LTARLENNLSRLANAARHPLIVEDLQWCAQASLDILLDLAREVRHLPVLFVASYRPDEIGIGLTRFLMELNRQRLDFEIHVPPLTLPDAGTILDVLFGARTGATRSRT